MPHDANIDQRRWAKFFPLSREAECLQRMKDAGALIEPVEVADALMYMLTRPRNVTIRDMIVLPSNFDV